MVTLLPDEKIRSQQEAEMRDIGKGQIYLTNKRVVFETVKGWIFKKTQSALEVDLPRITHMEAQENNIIIDTTTSKHIISSKNPGNFVNLVEGAIEALSAAGTHMSIETSKPLPPLTEFCPFCGAKLASNATFCDGCGKRVK